MGQEGSNFSNRSYYTCIRNKHFVKKKIEIEEKSLFKIKGFFLLFPNHVKLVNSKKKGLKLDETPPCCSQQNRV